VITGGPGNVTVGGWALDPDTTDPIAVHVYVDGAGTPVTAGGNRPDVGAVYGDGSHHGFNARLSAPTGSHRVCVYAINFPAGVNPVLRCATVNVG
jgi:hypothetical protein